jgi:hypothetical protein
MPAPQSGGYPFAFDAVATGSMTVADASNPRIDIVYVLITDPENGVTTPTATRAYLAGTAAASPSAPATPAGAFVLAVINVPKSGGGSPTVTWVAPYCASAGGQQAANTFSQLPTAANVGDMCIANDTGIVYRYSGSAWKPWESALITITPTVSSETGTLTSANGSITYKWVSGTILLVNVTANVVTAGTGAGGLFVTLPISNGGYAVTFAGVNFNAGTSILALSFVSDTLIRIYTPAHATVIASGVTCILNGIYQPA